MGMTYLMVLLLGIGVALVRRHLRAAPGAATVRDDPPARLLGWAVGLLAVERAEWGQAMLGELDHLDGRAQRWRFAVGCATGALVLPPWGRAAAAVGGLVAVAVGSVGVVAYAHIRYGLGTDVGTWVWAAILIAFLIGYILAGSTLLRRPGVAGPGLIGGLFVAVAWLAVSGFTFGPFLAPPSAPWHRPLLMFVVPAVVGAGGTLRGGSAAAGRRTARLAAVSAGLAVYLYGVLAVAVTGGSGNTGWTVAATVGDRLGNQVLLALVVLPLATAMVGWAGAAATARLRHYPSALTPPQPIIATASPGLAPIAPRRPADQAEVRSSTPGMPHAAAKAWRVTVYILLFAAMAGAVLLAVAGWLTP